MALATAAASNYRELKTMINHGRYPNWKGLDKLIRVMESITDAASAVSYVRGIQGAMNVLTSLNIVGHLWMDESCVPDKAEYDHIVVGAGTAGATVAGRLAQNKTAKVLLIEAGGDPTLETYYPGTVLYTRTSPIDYNFTTTTERYTKQCGENGNSILHAGKVLGGSSSFNIMIYERGNERDYESWVTASNNSGWSLDNTLEYFKRTENLEDTEILNSPYRVYHGVGGPLTVTKENRTVMDKYIEAFEELGSLTVIDLNSNETLGFSKTQYTISNQRQSSATSFLKPTDKTPYLDLLKNAEVTKILLDSNNNAVGIEAFKNNKKVTFKARKEVIISAGVINTPKLLMLSGIGPRKHLESKSIKVIADLPVGENYHDHVNVVLIHKLGKSTGTPPESDRRKYPFPTITGYVALNESSLYPDYVATEYFLLSKYAAKEALLDTAFYHRYSECILNRIYKKSKGYKLLHSFVKNTIPKSRGKVTLRSSDCKDQPIIDTGIYSIEADLEDHVDYLQDYFKLGDTKVFKEIGAQFVDPLGNKCREHEFGSREYWKCYALCMMGPANHAVGTCAMGSVVDGELNVIGVKRLRVVDASVIPVIPSVGTYATTLMIAEKASDIILQATN